MDIVDARRPTRRVGWVFFGALAGIAGLMLAVWLFQGQVERWALRAAFRGSPVDGPRRLDDRLVGRWTSPDGERLLISRSGVVWAETGDLIGSGTFTAAGTSRFVFDGPGFTCRYDLTVLRDVSDWHLVEPAAASRCPSGRFVRHFAF